MTNFGSGIWLYNRRTRLAILKLTVPATIIRSAWRGVARNAPAPKRSMSKREAPVAIISMAQQARPNVIGHMLDSRAQLIACSSVVVMTFSSLPNPSSHPISQLLKREESRTGPGACKLPGLLLDDRRQRGNAFRADATHPGQVAALPQVGEADEQDPEEDEDVEQGHPTQRLCRGWRADQLLFQ